ncbi:MAG TPA: hypothetical protein DD438_03325 [Verrucomicrobiales bacterium]|nr:hypothetical protein [Roseibacillus sp.]HBM77119.1 hypothetical protein [Verrucomicrobiales bacterium]
MTIHPRILYSIALCLVVTGCGGGDERANHTSLDTSASDMLASILLPKAPEGAVSISEARQNPAPGTRIILSGKVMGNDNPIIQSRALLTLGDPTRLDSCDLIPGDECPTPWDVCCADPDVVRASIATIQIIDENGKPVKAGLRGVGGLRELSYLIVVGEVAEGSNENNFLVNATGIHVAMAQTGGGSIPKQ